LGSINHLKHHPDVRPLSHFLQINIFSFLLQKEFFKKHMICVLENALKTATLCAVHWIHTSRSASAKMQQSKSVTDRTCAHYGIGRCGNMQELMEKIHSLSRLYLYI